MEWTYFKDVFEPKFVERAQFDLAEVSFDTMVGRGLSGALAVAQLGPAMRKNWCVVRKDETRHSSNDVEGSFGHHWIFVDDFIATGATFRETWRALEKARPYGKFIGSYLYDDRKFETYTELELKRLQHGH